MNAFWGSMLSVGLVSLVSLVGILTLVLHHKVLHTIVPYLISFSAGALLGDTFLHILPDLAEGGELTSGTGMVFLAGILIFFALEKFFHWHHSHTSHDEEIHSMVYMTMMGDTLHNFLDGILIAASFMASWELGVAASVAVILHEIPQELGNFGVLVHGGWSNRKALFWNFISALASFIGAGLVFFLQKDLLPHLSWLVAFAGANFLYLALSDILPELHKEHRTRVSAIHIVTMFLGMVAMYAMLFLE